MRPIWTPNGDVNLPEYIDGDGNKLLKIIPYLGAPGQAADTTLMLTFPTLWTADHKVTGIAYLVLQFISDRSSFGNDPDDPTQNVWSDGYPANPQAFFRGRKIYDPRNPGHSVSDSSTWEWSDNAALVAGDYMRLHPLPNIVGTFNEKAGRINYASVAASADICDEAVPIPDGSGGATTEKRYTIDATYQLDLEPAAILDTFRHAMSGHISFVGGQYNVTVGKYFAPTVTIDGDWVAGDCRYQAAPGSSDRYNVVKGMYFSPVQSYDVTECIPRVDTALQALHGETLIREIIIPTSTGEYRCQRYCNTVLKAAQFKYLQVTCNLRALTLELGQEVTVNLPEINLINVEFEVQELTLKQINQAPVVELVLRETRSDLYDSLITDYDELAPRVLLDTPSFDPAPVSTVTATGAPDAIIIEWSNPPIEDLLYVEIHSSATNDRATATLRTKTIGSEFVDAVAADTTRYYWLIVRGTNGRTSTWNPASTTAGVFATATSAGGEDGVDGVDGVDGTNGTDGTDGIDGASPNGILLNGSFENGTFTGWPTSGIGSIETADGGHTGTYYAEIASGLGGPEIVSKLYPAPPVGQPVRVSGYFRRKASSLPDNPAILAVRWYDTDGIAISPSLTSVATASEAVSGWQFLTGSVTVPAGAIQFAINLGSSEGVGAWQFDDVFAIVPGSDGFNTATLTAYKRSASAPVDNPGDVVYTFSDGSWTPANGWGKTIPAGSDSPYAVSGTALSQGATDTITSSDWSSPSLIAENGDDGLNVSPVYIYQRTPDATPPTLPTTTATYTFSDGSILGLNNGWTKELPSTGGPYRWATLATASSTTATDSITSAEWQPAVILAEDGTDGTNGTNGVDAFTLVGTQNFVVPADTAGGNGDYTNAFTDIKVIQGASDVTATATFALVANANVTATVNTATNTPIVGPKGRVKVTDFDGFTETLVVDVTIGAVTVPFEIYLVKTAAPLVIKFDPEDVLVTGPNGSITSDLITPIISGGAPPYSNFQWTRVSGNLTVNADAPTTRDSTITSSAGIDQERSGLFNLTCEDSNGDTRTSIRTLNILFQHGTLGL